MPVTLLDQNINVLWASLIISEIAKNGIKNFFISPGNRNAPLISALAHNDGTVKKICFDERAAGFMALGHARGTGKAAALVCTSGTALANYFPAVIEAYRDGLPLAVISADRPPELLGSDANQTIDQVNFFGNYTPGRLDIPCPSAEYPLRALLSKIDHLLQTVNAPVHLNCHFRDPLIPSDTGLKKAWPLLVEEAGKLFKAARPFTSYPSVKTSGMIPDTVTEIISGAERGILVIGRMHPFEEKENIRPFIDRLRWPVFCDIGSSLKQHIPPGQRIFDMDLKESIRLIRAYSPAVILHLGSGLVSKQFYDEILRESKAAYIMVNQSMELRDPAHRGDIMAKIHPDSFAASLGSVKSRIIEKDAHEFIASMRILEKRVSSEIPVDELTFPLIAQKILDKIPSGHLLFPGNSIAIREFDRAIFKSGTEITVAANRGVSGIEGNISTAMACSEGSRKPATAVIGDLSFIHDLNALALLKEFSPGLIIVVVNNRGGRIFERLPISNFPEILNPYITAPHRMNFEYAAAQFQIPYTAASTPAGLDAAYEIALQKTGPHIIEVILSNERDLEVFRNIRDIQIM